MCQAPQIVTVVRLSHAGPSAIQTVDPNAVRVSNEKQLSVPLSMSFLLYCLEHRERGSSISHLVKARCSSPCHARDTQDFLLHHCCTAVAAEKPSACGCRPGLQHGLRLDLRSIHGRWPNIPDRSEWETTRCSLQREPHLLLQQIFSILTLIAVVTHIARTYLELQTRCGIPISSTATCTINKINTNHT